MRITFFTRKFGNVERNSHCDVLHFTSVRVTRLVLDCNGVFAIKAYTPLAAPSSCRLFTRSAARMFRPRGVRSPGTGAHSGQTGQPGRSPGRRHPRSRWTLHVPRPCSAAERSSDAALLLYQLGNFGADGSGNLIAIYC